MVGDRPGYGHFVDLLTQCEETYSVQVLGHTSNLTHLLVKNFLPQVKHTYEESLGCFF